MQALGHAVGDARFQNHWNTFITEQDIANLGSFIQNICNKQSLPCQSIYYLLSE